MPRCKENGKLLRNLKDALPDDLFLTSEWADLALRLADLALGGQFGAKADLASGG